MEVLVKELELSDCIFRSNHASNYLPIGGTLPQDKEEILKVIRLALNGEVTLRPERLRAL